MLLLSINQNAEQSELQPITERQTIPMCSPVDVKKQVAPRLYYLTDKGRLRNTANAFGLSRPCVSVVVRRLTRHICVFESNVYQTEEAVTENAITPFLFHYV